MPAFHYQNLFSTATGNQPALENLLRGEIAINLADGIIFYRKVTNPSQEAEDTIASFSVEGTLNSLKDVDLSALAEGQALVYDSSTSSWKNVALTSDLISDFESAVQSVVQQEITDGTVQAHNANLDEISKLDAEGLAYRKSDGTYTEMTVKGTAGEVEVTTTPDTGSIEVGLPDVGTAGTYFKVTTDAQGRVTAGENPSTLAGFGITDGVHTTGDTLTGKLTYSGISEGTFEANDLITKAYADSVALGFVPHEPVIVASTANVPGTYLDGSSQPQHPGVGATLTVTVSIIDGVELNQNDRVLLVGQTDQKQNGIYVATTVNPSTSAVLTRAEDFDGQPTIEYDGLSVLVTEGTQAGSVYTLQNRGEITFGTDNITFVETFAPNEYVGGAGISVSSNTIAVKEGNTVKVIGGNLEVSSGTGNTGKFLQAQGDDSAAVWADVDLSDYVTMTTEQTISGVKTFSAAPVSTVEQTVDSNANELAKVGTVKTETTYTDNSASGATVAVGGISKGEKLENVSITDVIDKLLHPYVATTGVSLSMTPTNGGTFEVGDEKSVTGGTVRWTAGSTQVTKAEILKSGSPVGTAEVSSGASVSVTLSAADTIGSSAGTTTYTSRVTDNAGANTINGGSVNFTFVYPFYYGTVANAGEATGEAIAGMTKLIQAKGNKSVNYTADNECCVFAYPASYGNISSIIDANNFNVTSTFAKSTVEVTGLDGTPQQYNVYVNAAATLNGFKFTFNF